MSKYLTAALYKFVSLPNFRDLQHPVLEACKAHHIKGTLLLAEEGINGTIAGLPDDISGIFCITCALIHCLQASLPTWNTRNPTRMNTRSTA